MSSPRRIAAPAARRAAPVDMIVIVALIALASCVGEPSSRPPGADAGGAARGSPDAAAAASPGGPAPGNPASAAAPPAALRVINPRAVLRDPETGRYYVANLNGPSRKRDDNGFISLLAPDFSVIDEGFIRGGGGSGDLNAPKGLALDDGVLYVSDIDVIRRYDKTDGRLLGRIDLVEAGAASIVDLEYRNGFLYASDALAGKVFRVDPAGGTVSAYASVPGADGLAFGGSGDLFVTSWSEGVLYRVGPDGTAAPAFTGQGALDDAVAGEAGVILFTGFDAGMLYSHDPATGVTSVVASGLAYPGGLCLDAAGNLALVASVNESTLSVIDLRRGKSALAGDYLARVASGAADPWCAAFDPVAEKERLGAFLAGNWAGVFPRYGGPEGFLRAFGGIEAATAEDLVREARRLVPDGHFSLFLDRTHPGNPLAVDPSRAGMIPVALTECADGIAVVRSTPALREAGVSEGSTLATVDGRPAREMAEELAAWYPQSSPEESMEKAVRNLLSTYWTWLALPSWAPNPVLPGKKAGSTVELGIIPPGGGPARSVAAKFLHPSEVGGPDGFEASTLGYYGSVQGRYEKGVVEVAESLNEYAALVERGGLRWLIWHPRAFYYPQDTDAQVVRNHAAYLALAGRADRVVVDLRDTMGGGWRGINVMLGLVGADARSRLKVSIYDGGVLYGDDESYSNPSYESDEDFVDDFLVAPERVPGLEPTPYGVPVYVWTNPLAGSAADLFLRAVKMSSGRRPLIVGEPSAGRLVGSEMVKTLGYEIHLPCWLIADEAGVPLEGKPVAPDIEFDVTAEAYADPDEVLSRLLDAILESEARDRP